MFDKTGFFLAVKERIGTFAGQVEKEIYDIAMYEITQKKLLAPNIYYMEVHAPRVAASALPGQFVIVRTGELGERIPLTVVDYDREKGTVAIVVQIVGASSRKICALEQNDCFTDFVGPLGHPSEFVHESDESCAARSACLSPVGSELLRSILKSNGCASGELRPM